MQKTENYKNEQGMSVNLSHILPLRQRWCPTGCSPCRRFSRWPVSSRVCVDDRAKGEPTMRWQPNVTIRENQGVEFMGERVQDILWMSRQWVIGFETEWHSLYLREICTICLELHLSNQTHFDIPSPSQNADVQSVDMNSSAMAELIKLGRWNAAAYIPRNLWMNISSASPYKNGSKCMYWVIARFSTNQDARWVRPVVLKKWLDISQGSLWSLASIARTGLALWRGWTQSSSLRALRVPKWL